MRRATGRWRDLGAGLLVVLTCVSLLVSTLGVWANRTLLDTDRFTEVVADGLDEPAVGDALASYISRELGDALVESEAVAGVLPDVLERAAPIVERALIGIVEDQTARLLATETGRQLVVDATSAAHRATLAVLESEVPRTRLVAVDDDAVSLNLVPVIAAVLERIAGLDVVPDIDLDLEGAVTPTEQIEELRDAIGVDLPDDFGQVVVWEDGVAEATSLVGSAQRGLELFRTALLVQVAGSVLLAVLTLLVARNRRRIGMWLAVGVTATFVVASLVVDRLVEAVPRLASDPAARDAVAQVFGDAVSGLDQALTRTAALALVAVGVLAVSASARLRDRVVDVSRRSPDAVRGGAVVVALALLVLGGLNALTVAIGVVVVGGAFLVTADNDEIAPTDVT